MKAIHGKIEDYNYHTVSTKVKVNFVKSMCTFSAVARKNSLKPVTLTDLVIPALRNDNTSCTLSQGTWSKNFLERFLWKEKRGANVGTKSTDR